MKNKILVVDDDADILDSMQAILELENFKVQTSIKGDGLVPLALKNKPDLILLDLLLSGRDGKEICQDIKANTNLKHIPVVIMSAHPSAEKYAKQTGANAFIAKPFEVTELMEIINQNLQN